MVSAVPPVAIEEAIHDVLRMRVLEIGGYDPLARRVDDRRLGAVGGGIRRRMVAGVASPAARRPLARDCAARCAANPGLTPSFRRSLPETSCLFEWAFGPRNFMKNCPSGDGALRGLTRLPANFRRLLPEIRWQSRLSPVSGTGSRIGFSPLS